MHTQTHNHVCKNLQHSTQLESAWPSLHLRAIEDSHSQCGWSTSWGMKEREGPGALFSDLVCWVKDKGPLCPGARRAASGAGGEGSWAGGSPVRSSQRRRQLLI